MTDAELNAALTALRLSQQRVNEGIHELLNILAVVKGEVDLAVEKARGQLQTFYQNFPEFRD